MELSVILHLLFIPLFISSAQSQQTPLSTNPSYYYNLCAPSTCGNLSLPYPFTLPDLCNPASVQPLCPTNQSLLLTSAIQTDTYRVLSINFTSPTTTSLVVASDSLFTCGEQVSKPSYQSDASIFSLPFNYTAGTHFNCTAPIPANSIQGLQNASCIGCAGQDPDNVCYYAPGFVNAPSCQNYHVVTPGAGFNASAVRNLRAFLQLGFDLNYVKPFNCRGCEASGGRCGTSPSNASFVCFCPTSVHNSNCSDAISWRSTKQTIVATSSNHAELIALHEATRESVWLRSLNGHIQSNCGLSSRTKEPMTIYGDNVACIAQIEEGFIKGDQAKHLPPKLFYAHKLQHKKVIAIKQVRSSDNLTDLLQNLYQSQHF